jgi:hypothetical protein
MPRTGFCFEGHIPQRKLSVTDEPIIIWPALWF